MGPTDRKLTSAEVISKIDRLLAEQLEVNVKELKPDAHLFEDLGMDSLDAIDMALTIYRQFKIRPKEEELQAIRHLRDVHSLIQKYYDQSP